MSHICNFAQIDHLPCPPLFSYVKKGERERCKHYDARNYDGCSCRWGIKSRWLWLNYGTHYEKTRGLLHNMPGKCTAHQKQAHLTQNIKHTLPTVILIMNTNVLCFNMQPKSSEIMISMSLCSSLFYEPMYVSMCFV